MAGVFIVEGSYGEYEDYTNWIAGVFSTRKLANEFVRSVAAEIKAEPQGVFSWSNDRDTNWRSKIDPQIGWWAVREGYKYSVTFYRVG